MNDAKLILTSNARCEQSQDNKKDKKQINKFKK